MKTTVFSNVDYIIKVTVKFTGTLCTRTLELANEIPLAARNNEKFTSGRRPIKHKVGYQKFYNLSNSMTQSCKPINL